MGGQLLVSYLQGRRRLRKQEFFLNLLKTVEEESSKSADDSLEIWDSIPRKIISGGGYFNWKITL